MSIELKKANEYEKAEQEKIPVEEKPAFHVAAPVGWINDPKWIFLVSGTDSSFLSISSVYNGVGTNALGTQCFR